MRVLHSRLYRIVPIWQIIRFKEEIRREEECQYSQGTATVQVTITTKREGKTLKPPPNSTSPSCSDQGPLIHV